MVVKESTNTFSECSANSPEHDQVDQRPDKEQDEQPLRVRRRRRTRWEQVVDHGTHGPALDRTAGVAGGRIGRVIRRVHLILLY